MNKNERYIAIAVGVLLLVGAVVYYQFRQKEPIKQAFAPDSTVYSKQDYTTLVLDSTVLASFFASRSLADSLQADVRSFYQRRGYQYAWFSENRLANAANNFNNLRQSYISDFADSSLYNAEIDRLVSEAETQGTKFLTKKSQVQLLELLLTTTFFQYADKAYAGTVKDLLDLEWFIPRKKKNFQALLDTLVMAKGQPIREPVNRYYTLLKEKLRQYRLLQQQGGWPKLEFEGKIPKKGDKDSLIFVLKQNLHRWGDLKILDSTRVFDDSVAVALKRFQYRMGLSETGKLDEKTLIEVNRPVEERIRQMMLNMERLRWVPDEIEPNMLLVNIPEFRLHVFENGAQSWMCQVVVGKEATKTSIFKGNLSYVVLNPYWVVPKNIINNEILPKLKRNPGYLEGNNMEVVSDNKVLNPYSIEWSSYTKNIPYTIRQKPGRGNSLGKVKFLFPNSYSIYLHDTPSKSLFSETARAFSHGCIRVSEPDKLALHVLKNTPEWNEEKLNAVWKTQNEKWITVRPSLPVYIVYFTTWVDNTGQLNFRRDLYGLDSALAKEVFGEQ